MVKYIISYLLIITIFSCAPRKNEFGMPRFSLNRFSLKANIGEENKVKIIIDLNTIYSLVKVTEIKHNEEVSNFRKRHLVFYENGRVAIFENEPFDDINPKKAKMGIYEVIDNKLYIEDFTYSAQAGYFKSKESLMIEKDTLVAYDKYYKMTFKEIKFKSENKNLAPDW